MQGYAPLAYCGAVLLTVGALAWAASWAGSKAGDRQEVNTDRQEGVTEEEESITATADSLHFSSG
jgi:hypothetical protein